MAKVNRTIVPKYDWPGLENAVKRIKTTRLETGNFLIKYGRARYLIPMLEKGSIRIAPASLYEDSSLNPAIRDSELQLNLYSLASEVSLVQLDEKTGEEIGKIDCEGYIQRTIDAPTNYYVYCLANIFSPRMFGDFEADSCLVIHRPVEFVRLLIRTFKKEFPNWRSRAKLVTYVDPFNAKEFAPEMAFSKHFRYAYQKEYRVVWLPPNTQTVLNSVFLEVGDMRPYSELIDLRTAKSNEK
jgi:hypothetical protein